MTISSLESLRAHLQTAIELEHATLPPYLCALYSISGASNLAAVQVLQSVVLEEMLHLTLAANLLNAVGGQPVLDSPSLLPEHPTFLPHSDRRVQLSLRPFSQQAVLGFMAIEHPGPAGAPPQDDSFATIGQFYRAIGQALVALCTELGEAAVFCGDPTRQVTGSAYYGGAGRVVAVTDLASARRALAEIVEQGEGIDAQSVFDGDADMFDPERGEVGHYFRFQELLLGRRYAPGDTPASGPSGKPLLVDWATVAPMRVNPRSADHAPGSPVREAMQAFNSSYCTVLALLEHTFNGLPSLLAVATGAMYGLKQQMLDLISLDAGDGTTAGPSFEWVPPHERRFTGNRLDVLPHGPYLLRGPITVFDGAGEQRLTGGVCVLCRCGGSSTKPFCDGTHARIDFDGTETADHAPIAERRRAYPTSDGVTIYDDRTRCAHFGQCTDRLPAVFGVADEAFVDPAAVPSAEITSVVAGCPSGALSYAPSGTTDPEETHQDPSIHPIVDGPYRVRGGVPVIGADKQPYEARERQTLCRCGQSGNKPFCDGSHWYAGFRDPLPAELASEPADAWPWTDPHAGQRGRQRYAREHRAVGQTEHK